MGALVRDARRFSRPTEAVLSDGIDGLLTDPATPQIAEGILDVLQDERSAAAMGRAGNANAEARFTWSRIAATIERAYMDAARCA